MMRRGVILLLILIASAFTGCKTKEKIVVHAGEEKVPVLSGSDLIKAIPCFRCHSEEKFSTMQGRGKFSHKPHTGIGIHCNQCHEVKGHHKITINAETCACCHSLKTITYLSGGMTAIFNHERHTKLFSCKDCHPEIFLMKKGSHKMKMDDMYAGKYCGSCHNGKKAFTSMECQRCHLSLSQ
ncbi:MAG: cytochrome c3 family protein [Nitrospirae bacterium]|nr:cytochrome c3 family protein [Nitrospirota bacterium]